MIKTATFVLMLASGGLAFAQMATNPPAKPGAAETTASEPSSIMTPAETELRKQLAAAGYTDIKDIKQTGENWSGTAVQNGRRYKVRIGANGMVTKTPAG